MSNFPEQTALKAKARDLAENVFAHGSLTDETEGTRGQYHSLERRRLMGMISLPHTEARSAF